MARNTAQDSILVVTAMINHPTMYRDIPQNRTTQVPNLSKIYPVMMIRADEMTEESVKTKVNIFSCFSHSASVCPSRNKFEAGAAYVAGLREPTELLQVELKYPSFSNI
uniref:Uncharacterized protein n=1 Tax=Ciona intestinalis TaxID=7719 RepID=H2XRI6_CIOIN